MEYEIYDGGEDSPKQVLFDIEMYLGINDFADDENDKWFVVIHSSAFISGVVDFIKTYTQANIYKDNDWESFKKDCKELEELRGWLREYPRLEKNCPRSRAEAEKDYNEWEDYVADKVYGFAQKYGLRVNED